MEFISFIGEDHERAEGYSTMDMIERISSMHPARVIVTIDGGSSGLSEGYKKALNDVVGNPALSGLIVYACVDETKYIDLRKNLLNNFATSAENVVKKNLIEMIETTIGSYLEGYWKDYRTVNSEVTDSLFRAKHKLVSSMFWEMERDTWNRMLEEIAKKIKELEPKSSDVVLVDVEKKYWLLDNLED